MAQHLYGERRHFSSCDPMLITGDPNGNYYSGYDYMFFTYTSKNDGYAWHNYWRETKENWENNFCPENASTPSSDHLFQYFPQWLQDEITLGNSLAFISEADLLSPCPASSNPIANKDSDPTRTANSLWNFIAQERGADYVVAWLLTESIPDHSHVPDCGNGMLNYEEIRWHEAYETDGFEHSWFPAWWLRQE